MAISRSPSSSPQQPQTPASGRKVVRELFGLSLLFWGLFVLLTLITYSHSDPGINHVVSGSRVPITNSGGMFGAYISGLLVDLFGFAAFVWPLVFLAWGAGCVSTWFSMPWWRWFGFFVLGVCFITFGSAMNFGVGDVRGGGMLGASLHIWGQQNLSSAGAGLAWLFMLFISMELAFGISWMSLLTRGWGFAKEKAEARDISLTRIGEALGDTLRRYTPQRKPEEPVIALLDINTGDADDGGVSSLPPLTYADVSGAELAQSQAEAIRRTAELAVASAVQQAEAVSVPLSGEAALQAARDAALQAAQNAAMHAARAVLNSSMPPPVPTALHLHDPVDAILFAQRDKERADAAAALVPDSAASALPDAAEAQPAASANAAPDGFLRQAQPPAQNALVQKAPQPVPQSVPQSRPVVLSKPVDLGRSAQSTLRPAAEASGLRGGLESLVGSVRGLFGRKATSGKGMPVPAASEPAVSSRSVVPRITDLTSLAERPPVRALPVPRDFPEPAPLSTPLPFSALPSSALSPSAGAPASLFMPQATPTPSVQPSVQKVASPEPVVAAQAVPVQTVPPVTMPGSVHVSGEEARPVAIPPPWSEPAPVSRPKPKLPPLSLLQTSTASDRLPDMEPMVAKSEQLMTCLGNFGIRAELVRITPGPVVTMFEIRPAPGTKVSRILNLNQDLALALKALAVRIHPIPGQDTLGIEIPNEHRATVNFRKILDSPSYQQSESILTLALGADIGGTPVSADLAKMPHLLVGGATGAGKSVCINSLLLSLLYKATPAELKLLMVDPKVVELAMYADLPHLIHPVVTETQMAKNALEWAVHEMEQRYNKLARAVVRNIAGYNQKVAAGNLPPELADLEPMPYLVIVVDELSDLMLSAGKDVETAIVRLAQLARACGIHLIIATQRPSVDVVTGLIKANFPSRIAFQVTSAHDSRTILDTVGAELLLGKGDMLFKPSGSKPRRLHGPFVSDEDVQAVVEYWKGQCEPEYALDFAEWGAPSAEAVKNADTSGMSEEDALYGEIIQFAMEEGKKLSISKLQRRFRIGFNKAARFMERMEQDGIIQPAGHANRSRDVVTD